MRNNNCYLCIVIGTLEENIAAHQSSEGCAWPISSKDVHGRGRIQSAFFNANLSQ